MPRRKIIALEVNGQAMNMALVGYITPANFRNDIRQRDIFALHASDLCLSDAGIIVSTILSVADTWRMPLGEVEVFTGVMKNKDSYWVFRKAIKQ